MLIHVFRTGSLNGCLGQGYQLNTFDRIDFITNACMHWMCIYPRVSVIAFCLFCHLTKKGGQRKKEARVRAREMLVCVEKLNDIRNTQHFQYMPLFIPVTDRYYYFIVLKPGKQSTHSHAHAHEHINYSIYNEFYIPCNPKRACACMEVKWKESIIAFKWIEIVTVAERMVQSMTQRT